MANDDKVFKRINFFRGFVTTEDDWNDSERYHVDKHKLHNRAFHGFGVVRGWGDEFKVTPRGKGELSVEVFPGYAIEGQGNDVVLWKPTILPLNKADFKLPQTVFLVLRFMEEFSDFIAYKQNLDYKGHRRIAELCKLEWTEKQPDPATEVELCRVALTSEATKFELPKDPADPGANQIDRRFVPYAGVAGGFIEAQLLWQLLELIEQNRRFFASLARDHGVLSANNVVQSLITLGMLLESGAVGSDQLVKALSLVAELEMDVVNEVEATLPQISAKKDFSVFKRNIEYLRDISAEGNTAIAQGQKISLDKLKDLVSYQSKGSAALGAVVRVSAPARPTPTTATAEEAAPASGGNQMILDGQPGWEEVKVKSTPFEETINVDGVTWTMVDELDILNKEEEDSHAFTIREARDQYRTRQRLRYPDGTTVADSGIAHEGGYSEFEIHNVTPNVDLVLIRRMDYVRADYECEIYCEGNLVGIVPCPGADRRFRWRNWPFRIPAKYITKDRLRIRQVIMTAERDINFFHLWFYQAL